MSNTNQSMRGKNNRREEWNEQGGGWVGSGWNWVGSGWNGVGGESGSEGRKMDRMKDELMESKKK